VNVKAKNVVLDFCYVEQAVNIEPEVEVEEECVVRKGDYFRKNVFELVEALYYVLVQDQLAGQELLALVSLRRRGI
jgi:hypothetical protein